MTTSFRSIALLAVLALVGVPALAAAQDSRPLSRMKVNGGELEYEVRGTGDPVLLIHGTGVAATFAPWVDSGSATRCRSVRRGSAPRRHS